MITTHTLPDGRTIKLVARSVIERNRPMRSGTYSTPADMPQVAGTVDWTKGGTTSFPILGNDRYGDCMWVAACHIDQAMTSSVGAEAQYDESQVVSTYKKLSGGDHGLDEGTVVDAWEKQGLPGTGAKILDSLDLDVSNPDLVKSAMFLFGGVFFMLSVPSRWINGFAHACTWDAPALPNPMNGHGTALESVDATGNYRLLTWGDWCWLTPKGVGCCDGSGFVVFSERWFDKDGVAPNGMTYPQLAALWQQAGGKSLPPSPFPSVLPPA